VLPSLWAALAVALVLVLPVLTAVGARRRGYGVAAALITGLFFPVTWTVWYLRDERPYRSRHRVA
jgi:hypothetical protein